jgi:chromosome segregation ATPase
MNKTNPESTDAGQRIRMDDLEFKVSFLEKELEEYKEASRTFYRRLAALEEEIGKLNKEIPQSSLPVPEATWDGENRQVRP